MDSLTTDRLVFRPFAIHDLEDLHRLYGDSRCMQYITGRPRSKQKTASRLRAHPEQHRDYGFGLYAAIHRASGALIGRCGLEPRIEERGLAGELAWMFLPDWWGQGLGYEAGNVFLRFGLENRALHRVFATAHHENLASIAIMKRLGMLPVDAVDRGVEYEVRLRGRSLKMGSRSDDHAPH